MLWFQHKSIKYLGQNSQNFLGKFVTFFVILGLKILRLLGLKYFLKQISLNNGVNYCIFYKVPIFYEKSTLMLQKMLWVWVRSFVNIHPDLKIWAQNLFALGVTLDCIFLVCRNRRRYWKAAEYNHWFMLSVA